MVKNKMVSYEITRGSILLLLLSLLIVGIQSRAVQSDVDPDQYCPITFPDGCSCGLRAMDLDNGERRVTYLVSCDGNGKSVDLDFLKHLPNQTENLRLRGFRWETIDSEFFTNSWKRPSDKSVKPAGMASLRILDLEKNHLQQLDMRTILCLLPNLEELYLSDNELVDIDLDVACVQKLNVIEFRNNQLHFLSNETMEALDTLAELRKPQYNRKSSPPSSSSSAKHENHYPIPAVLPYKHQVDAKRTSASAGFRIDLSGNAFTCDCNFQDTLRWMRKTTVDLVHRKTYYCNDGYPEDIAGQLLVNLTPEELQCVTEDSLSLTISDESYSSLYTVAYVMTAIMLVMVLVFALVINFPNVVQCVKDIKKAPVVQRRYYDTMETETLT